MKKRCNKCGLLKVVNSDNFQRQAKAKDGFKNECKICSNKHGKKYKAENKEKISAARSIYTDEDMSVMVEDDTYKIISVKCLTSGCDNVMNILVDTKTDKRLPRKMCGACKTGFELRPLI